MTVHAVVVGIDAYSPVDSVAGPARDAAEFAEWLATRTPDAAVTCRLSPGAAAKGACWPSAEPATQDNVMAAFEGVRGQCRKGDSLVVYWAGPGVGGSDATRQSLYFADSASTNVAVRWLDLVRWLDSFGCGPQLLLFNACWVPAAAPGRQPPCRLQLPAGGGRPGASQAALYARPVGPAAAVRADGSTEFGAALRAELAELPAAWPPDLRVVHAALSQRWVEPPVLVDCYVSEQDQYVSEGHRVTLSATQPWLPGEHAFVEAWELKRTLDRALLTAGRSELDTLVKGLSSELGRRPARPVRDAEALVNEFWQQPGGPAAFRAAVTECWSFSPADRKELLELIVPVVVEDEEYLIDKLLRGLQDLCLQLPAPSREGSYAAYHAAHRETDRLGVDMLGDVPAYAERLLKSPNGSRFILFFDFLDRIAQLLAQEGLPDRRAAAGAIRDWCDGWAVESGAGSPVPGLTLQRLRQRRAETGENYLPIRRHILVRKAPTTQVVEAWQYWEYAALEQPVGDGPQHARPLPLSDAVDSTERAVVEILSGRLLSLVVAGPDDGPIVEVMLPPGALPTARVDQWEADGQRIGELLPVVVRPVRPRGTGIAPAAFDRWARMWHGPGSGEYVVSTPADRRYLNAPVGCLALDFCPTEQDVVAHLKDAQQVGIPAVLWGCNGASIASLVQGQHVRKLPDRVHRARRDNLPTGDVVLVWDNPYWVPNGAGELVWSDRCDGDGADDE